MDGLKPFVTQKDLLVHVRTSQKIRRKFFFQASASYFFSQKRGNGKTVDPKKQKNSFYLFLPAMGWAHTTFPGFLKFSVRYFVRLEEKWRFLKKSDEKGKVEKNFRKSRFLVRVDFGPEVKVGVWLL